MLGLFGVALSKRRAEKNTAVRSKETTDVSNRLTILAKKKRIRELAYYVVFSSFSRIRPNPDGGPPEHGRNPVVLKEESTHVRAKDLVRQALLVKRKKAARFSFFFMFRIH